MKCNIQGRIAFGFVYTTGAVYCRTKCVTQSYFKIRMLEDYTMKQKNWHILYIAVVITTVCVSSKIKSGKYLSIYVRWKVACL